MAAEAHCSACMRYYVQKCHVDRHCQSCFKNAARWALKESAGVRSLLGFLANKRHGVF